MAKKTHDLVVKVGSYTDKEGKTKNRYANVGLVIEQDDGRKFIMIDPCFNFAGVKREKDMVIVSMFEPKVKETTSGYSTETPNQQQVNWTE